MRGLLLEQRGRVCLKVDTRSFRRYLQNSKLKFCNSVSRMGQIMSTKCAAWTRLIRLQVRRRDLCNKETDVYGTVCKWFPMRGTFRKQEESLQSVFFFNLINHSSSYNNRLGADTGCWNWKEKNPYLDSGV